MYGLKLCKRAAGDSTVVILVIAFARALVTPPVLLCKYSSLKVRGDEYVTTYDVKSIL